MFISESIFDWQPMIESWEGMNDEWEVPYSYFHHAERLLKDDQKHFLIDSVSNLKRAVDHRIKQITTTYKIKKIPYFTESKSVLATLAHLEVIKPIMLGHLVDIRNAVEHKFSDPPPLARCHELSEFTWYFLRSTDQIAKQVSDGVNLSDSYDGIYHIAHDGHPRNEWQRTVSGHIPKHLLSTTPKAGFFEVSASQIISGAEYKKEVVGAKQNDHWALRYDDEDMIVSGMLVSPEWELWFFRLYFRVT